MDGKVFVALTKKRIAEITDIPAVDAGLFHLFLDFLLCASLIMARLHSLWFADYADGLAVSWSSVETL